MGLCNKIATTIIESQNFACLYAKIQKNAKNTKHVKKTTWSLAFAIALVSLLTPLELYKCKCWWFHPSVFNIIVCFFEKTLKKIK